MVTNSRKDQMGVELGKILAKNILSQLGKPEDVKGHDSSVRFWFLYLSDKLIFHIDNWFDSLLPVGS